jgi:serine/threonine protein phosphatase PrpC
MDGHGDFGLEAATFVKSKLVQQLINEGWDRIRADPKDALTRSIKALDDALLDQDQSTVDTYISGTTLTLILILDGSRLIVSNVGDGRAVVGKRSRNSGPLSVDQSTVYVMRCVRDCIYCTTVDWIG